MHTDSFMTIEEVAEYTALSVMTIRRQIRSGELKATKKVGRYRIRRSDVDAWMQE